MGKIVLGKEYVGEDGQWYFYTQRDLDLAQAYDTGGACAYYGRRASCDLYKGDAGLRKEYLRGYEEKPFGDKLYD